MKWLELIQVHANEGNAHALAEAARENFPEIAAEPSRLEVRFYSHVLNGSDLAILLFWEGHGVLPWASRICEKITENLGFYGAVSRSTWIELP